MCTKEVMNWVSAAIGFIAAVLWLCACFVTVPFVWPKQGEINDGIAMYTGAYGDKNKAIDVLMTARKQTRLNAWAAGATAVAALCQAISLML